MSSLYQKSITFTQHILGVFVMYLLIVALIFPASSVFAITYTWTDQAGSDNDTWNDIAISSDGTKLVAVAGSGLDTSNIYTSPDSGATWTAQSDAGLNDWRAVASSADGTKLVAVSFGDNIYTSSDSGVNWDEQTDSGVRNWFDVASSSDGTKLVAAVSGGYIYTSTDSGVNWDEQTGSGSRDWHGVTISSDGTKLAGIVWDGRIYTSTNSGVDWTERASAIGNKPWQSITSSGDGTKLVASVSSGSVYYSTNSGVDWTIQGGTAIDAQGVGASSDGSVFLAADNSAYIHVSTDYGATWTAQTDTGTRNWITAVASSDGTKVAGIVHNAHIWTAVGVSNTAPDVPSNLGTPAYTTGGSVASNQPPLGFDLSDPDVADTVKYRVVVSLAADFATAVVDYTSALAVQGAKTFTVGQAAGSGTYATGSESQTLADGSYYWKVKTIDSSAAESSYVTANSGSVAFIVDTDAPDVVSVTSSSANATYGVGSVIPILVTFSESVTVSGTPQIGLATGTPANTYIDYASGSGTNTLTFNYTVASGNISADLDYTADSSLGLNSGTIIDAAGNAAVLTLPTPGSAGSLGLSKNIVIHGIPVISEVTPVPTPSNDTTPSYTFTTDTAGTISYGGSCSGATTATVGSNTLTFATLSPGTYVNCTITVTDSFGTASNILTVSSFTINGSGGGGGIIIITPPAPKCTDPAALNNGGSLPCQYPVKCTDSKAENFGATGSCTYKENEKLCTDPAALNNGGSLPCQYPVKCTDSKAENFGATGSCTYKENEKLCTDPSALNNGGSLPCQYPVDEDECTGSSCDKPCEGDACGEIISDIGDTGTDGGGDTIKKETVIFSGGIDCAFVLSNTDPSTVDTVLEATRQSYCETTQSIKVSAKKIATILSSPEINKVEKVVTTTGVVAGTAVTVTTALFLNPISFSEILLIPVRLWSLLVTALGLKKRRRPWGVVYDSVTKQPLDPAYVTLRSAEGKDVASSLTDLDGRFGFVVPAPGNYALVAQKTNYTFPSQSLVGHDHDELYRDLYFGEYFTVATAGEIVIRNIPMDPEKFDWNEFAKKGQHLMKFYSSRNKILFLIADIFFGVGFAVTSVAVIAAPKGYNIALFILYTIVYFIKKYGVKARTFGYIADKNTGLPLSFGIVRVSYASSGVEVIHRITDGTGKYYCLLPNGEYVVKIDRKMPDGTYQTVAEKIPVSVTNGYLAKTFEV